MQVCDKLLFHKSELRSVRELEEESGISVAKKDLHEIGIFRQTFDDKPEVLLQIHVFVSTHWQGYLSKFGLKITNLLIGEPQESDEMRPRWFSVQSLPFDKMWADDPGKRPIE